MVVDSFPLYCPGPQAACKIQIYNQNTWNYQETEEIKINKFWGVNVSKV